MGCSPSHSGIIQSIAKNAGKPLKKSQPALSSDQRNEDHTISLLDPGSGFGSGVTIQEHGQGSYQQEKSTSMAHKAPESMASLSEEQRKEQVSNIADESMVKLTYPKGLPERARIRKQSSTGSEQEVGIGETNSRRSRRSKKHRSLKQGKKEKQIVVSDTEKKVDFPELLVKAHQNTYGYLNPNLSKYEAIISMANQATQTQLIMQQMVSFMALRFDEINKCLEEIAEDGEKLFKEVGRNLAWPAVKGNGTEHPDLLQQLLLYTVNKMQELNVTVSSITSNALQGTCSYLQSATNNLQEKLNAKKLCDERLMKTFKLFEDSTVECPQSYPSDTALYSEDSGIGGDNESIKEGRSTDKLGRQTSCDSLGPSIVRRNQEPAANNGTSDPMDRSDPNGVRKGTLNSPPTTNSKRPRVLQKTDSVSMNSMDSSTTLEQDSTNDQESEDSSGSSDYSEDGVDSIYQVTLPPRPLTSPAGTGAFRNSTKWLENPNNEEMSLKMKEAISEKIKFVPGNSKSCVWNKEEEVHDVLVRPSTANGSNRRTSKQRRSRSAESLRSQAEDPTLLELKRTQKDLNRKLEQLYTSNDNSNKGTQQRGKAKSFLHKNVDVSVTDVNSTRKLKACLDKSFNILPSQERVSTRRFSKSTSKDVEQNLLCTTTMKPQTPPKNNENGILKLDNRKLSPRKSVRKLIETFSPLDDSTSVKSLGPLQGVKKFGVPVLPPTIPVHPGLKPLNHHKQSLPAGDSTNMSTLQNPSTSDNNININDLWAEDEENFPPPPPEILFDDSFNVLQPEEHNKATETKILESVSPSAKFVPGTVTKTAGSQKIKTSLNVKDLLPCKNAPVSYMKVGKNNRNREPTISPRKFSSGSGSDLERDSEILKRHEVEQAAHLYRQSCKIIPLRNPGEMVETGNDGEITEPRGDVGLGLKPKQTSPTLQRSTERFSSGIRRISPTRVRDPSPPNKQVLASPAENRTYFKPQFGPQTRVQPLSESTSPAATSKIPSPPVQKKLPSPPLQQKISSPSVQYKLPSSPSHKNSPSPPVQRKLPSSPSHQKSPSPSVQRKLPSPSSHQKSPSSTVQRKLPSPPGLQKPYSPAFQRKLPSPPPHNISPSSQKKPPSSLSHQNSPSPPTQWKPSCPPLQKKLPSPPQVRRQPSPPSQGRILSPPSSYQEPSPPIYCTPSPPESPSFPYKGSRRSSDESQLSTKWIGNAQSIFCPSSTSLFETKPPSPISLSSKEAASHVRPSFSIRQNEDPQRRFAMSAANPQPFVRRSYSDRKPRVQLRAPVSFSATAVSEPSLQQLNCEVPGRRESEPWAGHGLAELSVSQPDLCVIGQGFQP
ncbi:hypothetical protein GDO86_019364 [Hymenochirus boettgeri]|uniref:Photoreceptor cilium actin regulator n=1 Tax=Hymenochirus boettgeri TaxID=247094 RepID=A0A8T2ILF9_9PIPI|nr:hypothetical protein GDO86_019364 [Hymenochirus boettgeri]